MMKQLLQQNHLLLCPCPPCRTVGRWKTLIERVRTASPQPGNTTTNNNNKEKRGKHTQTRNVVKVKGEREMFTCAAETDVGECVTAQGYGVITTFFGRFLESFHQVVDKVKCSHSRYVPSEFAKKKHLPHLQINKRKYINTFFFCYYSTCRKKS